MIRKLYILTIALFVVVVAMAALLLTAEYTIPAKPDLEEIKAASLSAKPSGTDTAEASKTDPYPELGKTALFDTLYPKPTTAPTPVPTQKPDMDLAVITANWKVTAVLPGGMAFFEDTRAKEEWQMKVGEAHPVKLKSETFDIKLESTNDKEFTVKITFAGPSGQVQSRVLSMFD